jgi:hypothetical protein
VRDPLCVRVSPGVLRRLRAGGRLVARDGGTVRPLDDKFLMVLGRDAEGEWRILRLMWSANRHD